MINHCFLIPVVVPVKYTLKPFFVANRARFFNMATLYTQVIYALNDGIEDYLRNKIDDNFSFQLGNFAMADKKYVEWEKNGGKDLNLSAFKLTSRQMLWFCFAHVYASQTQEKREASVSTLRSTNLHVIFKSHEEFREAYRCGEMTQQELDSNSDYWKKLTLLRQTLYEKRKDDKERKI